MRGWMNVGLKWGLAAVYMALCLSLLWLFPGWLRLFLLGFYVLYVVWEFWNLDRVYSQGYDIRPLTPWDIERYEWLREQLGVASRAAGLRREPAWTVVEDEEPNAFALGGARGIVAFTTGLLRHLPPEEILAIAGHELEHLASRDSLPPLLGGVWLNLIAGLSELVRGSAARGGVVLFVLFARLVSFVLDMAMLVISWVAAVVLARRSRHEEHMADLAGARLTSAQTFIAALQRLEGYHRQRGAVDRQYVPWSPEWIAMRLHASHPPTEARIRFLQEAAVRGEIGA